MRWVIIAGEASGDLHGSNLIRAIRHLQPNATFRFIGGERMKAAAEGMVKDYRDMAFMGFLEVITHLNTIQKNLRLTKKLILDFCPEAVILIDYPGFNLRIADFTRRLGIPVFYYISPKVWAWKKSRIKKIRASVDRMFCILPFEVDFYRQHEMEVSYHGNPVVDEVARYFEKTPDKPTLRASLNLDDTPLILLAPGSRKQELFYNLPELLMLAGHFPDYRLIIAGAPGLTYEDYEPYLEGKDIPVVFGRFYDLLQLSEAAVVTSGTATLETALMNVPQVVVYKGNAISYAIARKLVKVKYISLVNLIADAPVIRELIQEEVHPGTILAETGDILKGGEKRNTILEGYDKLRNILGKPGVALRVAQELIDWIERLSE